MDPYKKTTKDVIAEAMAGKGLNIDKLAELTSVPKHFLIAILEQGKISVPPPYVRGYLFKLAEVLSLDANVLWQDFSREMELKTSGEKDRLPQNRFAFKPLKKGKIILTVLAVFVIIGGGILANRILRTPWIEIANPVSDSFSTGDSRITVRGKINPGDKLTIIDQEQPVDENGYFEKEINLSEGVNTIRFKVKRFLGKETEVTKQIFYQPQ